MQTELCAYNDLAVTLADDRKLVLSIFLRSLFLSVCVHSAIDGRRFALARSLATLKVLAAGRAPINMLPAVRVNMHCGHGRRLRSGRIGLVPLLIFDRVVETRTRVGAE